MCWQARRYDSRTTTFSPEGRLYQVEYAMEAISHAGICVGILAKDGIVLAVEKKITSKLLENISSEKMYKVLLPLIRPALLPIQRITVRCHVDGRALRMNCWFLLRRARLMHAKARSRWVIVCTWITDVKLWVVRSMIILRALWRESLQMPTFSSTTRGWQHNATR